jgi:8-oxo-dGTP diphosphatase
MPQPYDRGMYEVEAAGCVVRHEGRIAVIHRPRYDDWSLPKGKLDPGESFEDAAVREVEEEIGVRGTLGTELEPATYTDHRGRSKIVRYWVMDVDAVPEFAPNDEVDEVRWLAPDEARALLSYERDRVIVP